jgi:predicted NAD/FAD-binding protein
MPKPLRYILILLCFFQSFAQESGKRKVAIIGGGIAGVSAAHYILENDIQAEITIFEKEKVLGGNAQTRVVTNSEGQSVKVDIGAQYFTDETWGNYIALLKRYSLVSADLLWEFPGTFVVRREGKEKPIFISPKGLSKRGEKIRNLRQFYRFYKAAHELYFSPDDNPTTVEKWLGELELNEDFKTNIALPFMASSLGTTTDEMKTLSAIDIVKLFAFRGPLARNTFYILNEGMGNTVRAIGDSLNVKGVQILCSTPVVSVVKSGNKFLVKTGQSESLFDFVVFAVHPDQAAKMLNQENSLKDLTETLTQFPYYKAQLVLHRDSTFGYRKRSFLNIRTNVRNEIVSHTMDLGCIHPDYEGIYKSWLNDSDLEKVRSNGTFIDVQVFDHALLTPEFKEQLEKLYALSATIPNIYFAGGWSEGQETQETGVNSGEKAAYKCRKYFEKL